MNKFRAQVVTKMIPPVQLATATAVSALFGAKDTRTSTATATSAPPVKWPTVTKTFRRTVDIPCVPRIEITKATVTFASAQAAEDGYPASIVIEYQNSGGAAPATAPANQKQFEIQVKNATSGTPGTNITFTNPLLATNALTIPAPNTKMTTSAFLLSNLLGVTGKVYCSNKTLNTQLEIKPVAIGSTPPVNSADYKFMAPVQILCGVNLEITGANYKTGTTNVIQVAFKNSGASPSNTAPLTNKFDLKATPPAAFSPAPVVKAGLVIPNNGATGSTEITMSGNACGSPVAIDFSATRTSTGASIGQKSFTLTPPCPPAPKIEVTAVNLSAPETGFPSKFNIAYKNTGATVSAVTPLSWKSFQFQVRDTTANKTWTSPAMTTPAAVNALQTTASFELASLAGDMYCGGGAKSYNTSLEITPTVAAPGYKYTAPVTIYCGINFEITSANYKSGTTDVLVVSFRNRGATPDPTLVTGTTTTAGFNLFKLKVTPPPMFAPAVEKSGVSIPNSGLTSRAEITLNGKNCGAPVSMDFIAIRNLNNTLLTKTSILVTPPACPPPTIAITGVSPGTVKGTFSVAYQNTGETPTTAKTFSLTITNSAANKMKAVSGLPVPASNVSPAPQTSAIALADLGMSCGNAANLSIVAIVPSGVNTAHTLAKPYTTSLTVPCPKHDLVTGSVYVSLNYDDIRVGWAKTTNAMGTDFCTGKSFKIKIVNAADSSKSCVSPDIQCGMSSGSFVQLSGCSNAATSLNVTEGSAIKISIDHADTIGEFNEDNNNCSATIGAANQTVTGYGVSLLKSRTGPCGVLAP